MGLIFGWIIKLLGSGVLDSVLKYFEDKANNDTERQRIAALRDQHAMTTQANVITSGMEHAYFWIPWLIATVPLAVWFGWGMMDTTLNGALPDVAEIPPGLLPWAQTAWGNLFYSGGGVAAASIIGKAIARR
jgi:hypothetical protein